MLNSIKHSTEEKRDCCLGENNIQLCAYRGLILSFVLVSLWFNTPPPGLFLLFFLHSILLPNHWFPKIIALICSTILSKQLRLSASSPQYIILTQSTAIPPNPAPPQQEFPHLDQDPVVFTPLTVANIPVAQT